MIGYKLFRVRRDGTLGPLFINARARLPLGMWMAAESHPTKGYAYRPWWHVTAMPYAPHLSMRGRAWFEVEMTSYREQKRPVSQGGLWYLADAIKIVRPVPELA